VHTSSVMVRGIGPAPWAFQQSPSLQAAALKMPPWLAPYLSEPLGHVIHMQQECLKQVEVVKQRMTADKYSEERPIISSTLLSEDDKPDGYRVPPTTDLKDEAYTILVVAADTTGNSMTVAAFNVMRNPPIYERLAQELERAFPDPNAELPFIELERLPCLAGLSPVLPFPPPSKTFLMSCSIL
jgi:cytochrome P450